VRRFFELYCETWRRSVLYLQGQKRWWRWLPQVRLRDLPRLARILARTQRLMDPEHYLAITAILDRPPDGACLDGVPGFVCGEATARPVDPLDAEPRG
jgi:hypothetical protein